MRIIVVIMGDIFKFPPVLSLLNALEDNNIDTVVISSEPSGDCRDLFRNVRFEILSFQYEHISSPVKKMISIPKLQKSLWDKIDKYYDEDSLIWVITDVTLKYLGNRLINRRYVLQLLELSQDLLYYKKLPILKLDAKKIGNNAKAIVVPEYNRAHIMAAWWQLKQLPFVLPNKPVIEENIEKYTYIEDDTAREIIEKLKGKRIILYQGILNKERPLYKFIKAIDKYDGKYAFVVMSGDPDIYSELNSENYYYIPYVRAPKHLQITSHAYIGVLSYVPTSTSGYSPLNALYCAPNKTFEFSKFGIPMLGNNIPGLKFLFDTEGIGCCFEKFDEDSICKAIDEIETNYSKYSSCSKAYFENCDYNSLLNDILLSLE